MNFAKISNITGVNAIATKKNLVIGWEIIFLRKFSFSWPSDPFKNSDLSY